MTDTGDKKVTIPPGWEWAATAYPGMTPNGEGWQVLATDGQVTHWGRPRCACTPERGVLDCPLHGRFAAPSRPETYYANDWIDLRKAVERLAARDIAIARVRALAEALRTENQVAGQAAIDRIHAATRILAALDGDTPKDQT